MRLLHQHHPWVLIIGLALALAEYVWRHITGRGYDLRSAAASLGVALGQMLLRPLNRLITTAIQLGWTETVSLGWIAFVPLALIGLAPGIIDTMLALGLVYQYVLHTEAPVSFGPLE